MPEYTRSDWYNFPLYYDIVFDADTTREADFLEAVLEQRPVPERQASFEDGYRAAVVCEAIHSAAREGRRIEIQDPVPAAAGSSA
jgi:predicted dehydrogenase